MPKLQACAALLLSLLLVTLAACGEDKKTHSPSKQDGGENDAEDKGNLTCFGDDTLACSACLAEKCCESFGPCNGETGCYHGYSCLLRCTKTLAECLVDCEGEAEGADEYADLAACGTVECGGTSCQPAP